MKLTTVMTVSAITAFAAGCSFMTPRQHPSAGSKSEVSTHDVTGLVEAGIEAYNNGDIATAKSNMEAVLQATREKPMKGTRARAHFYLAALAWDVGDEKKTDEHLHQCRFLQPLFEPDWTFLAPELRKRYENLKPMRGTPTPKKPAPEKPAVAKPTPEKPAPKKPAPEKPAAAKPASQKPTSEEPASEKPAQEKPASTQKPVPQEPAKVEAGDGQPAPKS